MKVDGVSEEVDVCLGGGRPHGRQAQGDEAAREELPGGGAGKVTEAKLSDSLS